jgi:eukaryotic-like serine/threonine-protein kinase
MGVVYRAYDPSLRRTVALKLVNGSHGRRTARRVEREAQSQARLTHPNVVEIFDVGVSGRDVYITMELVEGPTLAQWLASERPWREVLALFLETARGLIAAHEAGLVHRDFKPANVLLTASGRPKVADFGLAIRSQDTQAHTDSMEAAPGDAGLRLTETGSIMGTPRYMAPEQHRGERVDASVDQFAFCVALFEALFDVQAFPADTIEELVRLKHAGPRRPPDRHGVPRRVLAALVRGLEPQPERRFASMSALRDALERAARPRRALFAAGAIAALGLGGIALAGQDDRGQCSRDPLAATWADHRARLDEAFEASSLPHERRSWASLRAHLDAHVDGWTAALAEVCKGDPPDPLQLGCLRQRQRRFEALALVLSRSGTEVLSEPSLAMSGLEPAADCLDPQRAAQGEQIDDPRFAVIDAKVAEAEALAQTPLLDETRTAASDGLAQAQAAGFEGLEARAALQLGISYLVDDELETARPLLEHAYFLADTRGDHFVAAVAASKVVFALALGSGTEADANRWAEHAMVHLEQMDGAGPVGVVEQSIGMMLHRRGRYAEAAEHHMRAALDAERVTDAEHPLVAVSLSNAGNSYVFAGEVERGLEVLERAASIHETAYGRDSPERAVTVVNIGLGLYRAGRYSEALARFDEALAAVRGLDSGERRLVGQTLINRALCLTALGEHDQAIADLMEAREILVVPLGETHPIIASIDMNMGLTHYTAGRAEPALQFYERALAAQVATLGADHPEAALTEHNIGVTLNDLDRFAAAEPHLRRSSAVFTASLGAEADFTALSMMELARTLDGLDRYDEALELVTRSLAILGSKGAQHDRFLAMGSLYRGHTLRKLGRIDEARAELEVVARRLSALPDADPGLATELQLERSALAKRP